MEQAPALAETRPLLVDPAAAQFAIERISKLKLPRRICRPLDRKRERIDNAELAQFDAAVESAVEAEAASDLDLAEIESVTFDA
jgi:hypothetical protein